ncbi:hypothetical protein GCM10027081_25120 [Cupriavidus yeoncheonensis]
MPAVEYRPTRATVLNGVRKALVLGGADMRGLDHTAVSVASMGRARHVEGTARAPEAVKLA